MRHPVLADTPFVKSPKTRPQRSKPVRQALDLQDLLYVAAHKEDIAPSVLAQVARAWCDVEDQKRVIQMKPAPKPIDVSNGLRKPKRSAANGFSEVPSATPGAVQDKPKAGGG